MKEILSSQFEGVSGGWQDQDGSGHQSATNGGSQSGGGNSGNHGPQSYLSQNSPYGSGSEASGVWGGPNTYSTPGGGYSGNGTGAGRRDSMGNHR